MPMQDLKPAWGSGYGFPHQNRCVKDGRLSLAFCSFAAENCLLMRKNSLAQKQPSALALTTRSHLLPDVPSLAETGYPVIGKDDWVGVFIPARTPKEIVIALSRSIATFITSTDATEPMATLGFEPLASTPEEFGVRIGVEIDTWGKMLRATNIKAD
jgi:tripartite-type tricarboxylate transporter receptor subunit TctC